MAKREPKIISLGDREWIIRPLTLGQVQEMEPIVATAGAGLGRVEMALKVIKIALTRDNPDDAELVEDIEATTEEASIAMMDIYRLGGFLPEEGGDEKKAPEGTE